MQIGRRFFKYVIYFVLGNIIFNVVFSAIKTISINHIGGKDSFIENIYSSFGETFIFYTILFVAMVCIDLSYKKFIINTLNERLGKMKEGSGGNEK